MLEESVVANPTTVVSYYLTDQVESDQLQLLDYWKQVIEV